MYIYFILLFVICKKVINFASVNLCLGKYAILQVFSGVYCECVKYIGEKMIVCHRLAIA